MKRGAVDYNTHSTAQRDAELVACIASLAKVVDFGAETAKVVSSEIAKPELCSIEYAEGKSITLGEYTNGLLAHPPRRARLRVARPRRTSIGHRT